MENEIIFINDWEKNEEPFSGGQIATKFLIRSIDKFTRFKTRSFYIPVPQSKNKIAKSLFMNPVELSRLLLYCLTNENVYLYTHDLKYYQPNTGGQLVPREADLSLFAKWYNAYISFFVNLSANLIERKNGNAPKISFFCSKYVFRLYGKHDDAEIKA